MGARILLVVVACFAALAEGRRYVPHMRFRGGLPDDGTGGAGVSATGPPPLQVGPAIVVGVGLAKLLAQEAEARAAGMKGPIPQGAGMRYMRAAPGQNVYIIPQDQFGLPGEQDLDPFNTDPMLKLRSMDEVKNAQEKRMKMTDPKRPMPPTVLPRPGTYLG